MNTDKTRDRSIYSLVLLILLICVYLCSSVAHSSFLPGRATQLLA